MVSLRFLSKLLEADLVYIGELREVGVHGLLPSLPRFEADEVMPAVGPGP